MSVPDHQLDHDHIVECPIHGWIYPAGAMCQACLRDINDEYADQAINGRMEERETNP